MKPYVHYIDFITVWVMYFINFIEICNIYICFFLVVVYTNYLNYGQIFGHAV